MNLINKNPVASLGYQFIPTQFIPKGKDEYHLRNIQNRSGIEYRRLTAYEIEVLVRNRNRSDDWNKILVSDAFNPELVQDCKFYGLVRIGKLEPWYLEFHNLRLPVGLYNSTIISCDLGDNVAVDNVNYLSHYIIGNEVMLANVNELATTNYAKFGNGVVKQGENEQGRIWLELCNENGGRNVVPFNGMLPGDAWLWTRNRHDQALLDRFLEFTEKKFDKQRGYYGKIGDRTVIKNCKIIKDVWVGSDAYLKGANKLKNLTINSSPDAKSQIGEGCEIVNGIVGFGCRIFYGVKAVRFVMASHSQLKYGARLINSYLGNNSTISCCEVLNSLIFPLHEQHHNNSFLCASVVMGQSNMAAGATIGSNHNSRSPDGEIIAGRGFWPGLCVSLKHNSRFAGFTIIAKGDFPASLNIALPFSLVSNDTSADRLMVMPAYWFMYNMYALARNAWKYADRDRRTDKTQTLEFDFLAPDTVNEIFEALQLLETFAGKAWLKKEKPGKNFKAEEQRAAGAALLAERNPALGTLEILADGFEDSRRPVQILKVQQAWDIFRELVQYYGTLALLQVAKNSRARSLPELLLQLPARPQRVEWENAGGQLIPKEELEAFKTKIRTGKVKNWDAIHQFYKTKGDAYPQARQTHAIASLFELLHISKSKLDGPTLKKLLQEALNTRQWMVKGIYDSRAKDYSNPFRKMVYETNKEMNAVLGPLESNAFIQQEIEALKKFRTETGGLIRKLKL